jgi:RNA exonuclease 1
MLTLEQMIENEYPIPSHMADVFEKPEGWVETPAPAPEPLLNVGAEKAMPTIYAIDCEMVRKLQSRRDSTAERQVLFWCSA